mgnify:CR=1 FL=1
MTVMMRYGSWRNSFAVLAILFGILTIVVSPHQASADTASASVTGDLDGLGLECTSDATGDLFLGVVDEANGTVTVDTGSTGPLVADLGCEFVVADPCIEVVSTPAGPFDLTAVLVPIVVVQTPVVPCDNDGDGVAVPLDPDDSEACIPAPYGAGETVPGASPDCDDDGLDGGLLGADPDDAESERATGSAVDVGTVA